MRHQQKQGIAGIADALPADLSIFKPILRNQAMRVTKYGNGIHERYAMFAQIACGLVFIPFKNDVFHNYISVVTESRWFNKESARLLFHLLSGLKACRSFLLPVWVAVIYSGQ